MPDYQDMDFANLVKQARAYEANDPARRVMHKLADALEWLTTPPPLAHDTESYRTGYQNYRANLFRLSRKHEIPLHEGMSPADYVNSALAIMMAELGLHPPANQGRDHDFSGEDVASIKPPNPDQV